MECNEFAVFHRPIPGMMQREIWLVPGKHIRFYPGWFLHLVMNAARGLMLMALLVFC